MKNLTMKLMLAIGLSTAFAAAAIASPGHIKSTKPLSCPVCHMPLSKKKDKMHTVAVRLKKGGPIYYCCSKCKMPKSVLVKKTPAKKMHKMKKM